ncbi:hypothetical protein E2C01_034756 [Portunus trituberculatus]|uniref:Uncharacterized protein n=1 Tax=Portunus trituberculatus TaxID=210409 RepID=A0A5B7F2D0_PORTR|nr:hypothetical protein [Portunus trituberculatus]
MNTRTPARAAVEIYCTASNCNSGRNLSTIKTTLYIILFPELNPQEVRQRSPLIGRYSSSPLGLTLQHHLLDR